MTDTLTSVGLAIKTLDERLDEVKALLRANISDNLYLGTDSPQGQIVSILTEKIQAVAELLEEVHGSFDPSQATGNSLSALAALTGTFRRLATKGTVTLTVNLDGGKTLPAGSIAAVATDPTNRWVTDADVVAPPGPAANYSAAATAETAGVYQALAGTITTIVTAVAGWNSVTNASDATEGQEEETDAELRSRRALEVSLGGSTSPESIQADISNITGIDSVLVYENEFWFASGGMPPHSIEAVIWDGAAPAVANATIAQTIYESKPAGIQAYGSTVVTHTDDQGIGHQIGFSRATQINILVDITLVVDSDYVGDAAVQAAIAALVRGLDVGADVYRDDIIATVKDLAGVVRVDLSAGPLLAIKPGATAAVDIAIAATEKAWIDDQAADITVTT